MKAEGTGTPGGKGSPSSATTCSGSCSSDRGLLSSLLPLRLSRVERYVIWQEGPGQEIREHAAVLVLLVIAVLLLLLTVALPFIPGAI